MKKIVFLGFFVLTSLICCSPPEHEVPNLENEALAVRYLEATMKGDITTMNEVLADQFIQFGPATKDSVARPVFLVDWKNAWDEEYSSMSYDRYAMLTKTVKEGRVAGDWVLDWGKLTMNHKNGKPSVTIWFHTALRIKDKKIERQRIFFDMADLMTQQGYTIMPPSWDEAEEMKK